MPWIPEGSLVSKNRFYEVRREQRPKSYSPPPTPPASRGPQPLNALSFPAIVPPPTVRPALKRAASFHPGGSQKLRREASVLDGRVTMDMGFKLRSRSSESIVPSTSEPKNMDLIVRQLGTGHQSGLERLKNSMLSLMKTQSQRRYPVAGGEEKRSESPFSTAAPNETRGGAEGTSHEPLAARRGLPVPSPLKFVPTCPLPPFPPYHPDIPTPFRGSPSATTPSLEITGRLPTSPPDKRESIDVEDMCNNLRYLVSPAVPKEEHTLPQSRFPATYSMNGGATSENTRTPPEDWNFALELEGVYGDDPFSYFHTQERLPTFLRPLSTIPDVVPESMGMQLSSGSSAISVSTFPEPPTDNPTTHPIPYITICGGGPTTEYSPTETRLSFSPCATASDEDLADSGDSDETHTSIVISSTETSPRSSEDKDEPLAVRRFTLLARSPGGIPKLGDCYPAGGLPPRPSNCDVSLIQEALKPATKIVRFASETEEHAYLANPEVTCTTSGCQRPRSSSVPPPRKGSLRHQPFLRRDQYKEGRLSRSEPITFPSRIPKKRALARVASPGRHTAISRRSMEAVGTGAGDALTPAGLGNGSEGRKRLSSLIPAPGPKTPPVPSSLDRDKPYGGKRATGCNSRLYVSLKQPSRTPTPQPAQCQQKTSLAASWSMTLRQYVKGGDASGEKRHISRSPSSRRDRELNFRPAPPVGARDSRKSSLPVKKASFFREGGSKVAPVGGALDRSGGQGRGVRGDIGVEGNAIGLVDKTGGISYIAPPKPRVTSQSQGRAKEERNGPSTTGTKTLRPAQIINLLGRLKG